MKAKHVMMFEELDDWRNIVNYDIFFRIECDRWLNNYGVGKPVFAGLKKTYHN